MGSAPERARGPRNCRRDRGASPRPLISNPCNAFALPITICQPRGSAAREAMVATASQPFFGFQWVNPSVLALVIVAMAYLGVQELGSAGRPANEVALLPAWPLTRPLAVSLPAPSWPLGNLLRISEPAPVD